MQKKLYTPKLLPPISTVAHGFEYYSKTSKSGMVYCRKQIGHSQEVNRLIVACLNISNILPNIEASAGSIA
jgi:hypothetical protein